MMGRPVYRLIPHGGVYGAWYGIYVRRWFWWRKLTDYMALSDAVIAAEMAMKSDGGTWWSRAKIDSEYRKEELMAASTFTEAQIRRAVKGAMDAGLPVGAVEVSQDGTIRILPAPPKPTTDKRKPEPW